MDEDGADIAHPVLLDNTVLTNFAQVGAESVVLNLWPEAACTTHAVLAEYDAGAAAGFLPDDAWRALPVIELTAEEASTARQFASRLGAGERTCLAAALHRSGRLASDDLDARRAAQRCGVRMTGTIGILVVSVRRGLQSHAGADALLASMLALGYRSPVKSISSLLET